MRNSGVDPGDVCRSKTSSVSCSLFMDSTYCLSNGIIRGDSSRILTSVNNTFLRCSSPVYLHNVYSQQQCLDHSFSFFSDFFDHCSATDATKSPCGGAICMFSSPQHNLVLRECIFQSCSATGDGGCIYAIELSSLRINTTAFVSGLANGIGGCICCGGFIMNLNLITCAFSYGSSHTSAAGLYLILSNDIASGTVELSMLQFMDCNIIDPSADRHHHSSLPSSASSNDQHNYESITSRSTSLSSSTATSSAFSSSSSSAKTLMRRSHFHQNDPLLPETYMHEGSACVIYGKNNQKVFVNELFCQHCKSVRQGALVLRIPADMECYSIHYALFVNNSCDTKNVAIDLVVHSMDPNLKVLLLSSFSSSPYNRAAICSSNCFGVNGAQKSSSQIDQVPHLHSEYTSHHFSGHQSLSSSSSEPEAEDAFSFEPDEACVIDDTLIPFGDSSRYIDANIGVDEEGCGTTKENPCRTLKKCIDDFPTFYIYWKILFHSGTYNEETDMITLYSTSMRMVGESKLTTVLSSSGLDEGSDFFFEAADSSLTFDKMTLLQQCNSTINYFLCVNSTLYLLNCTITFSSDTHAKGSVSNGMSRSGGIYRAESEGGFASMIDSSLQIDTTLIEEIDLASHPLFIVAIEKERLRSVNISNSTIANIASHSIGSSFLSLSYVGKQISKNLSAAVLLNNSAFVDCSSAGSPSKASYGGLMKLQLLENRTMRVLGCSFIRCKASEANGRGGIFFLNGSRSETPNCWMFENVQFTENSAFLGKNLYFIANNMTSFSPAQIIYTKSPATMELENAFIGEDGEGKMIDLVELYVKNRISPYYVSSSHPKALNWISCGSAEVPCETLQMASIFPFFNKQRSIFIAIDEIVVNTPFSWQRFTVSSVSSELTKKALMRFRAEKDNPHTAMLIGKVSMQLESLNITLNDPEEAMLSTLILCEDCFASFEKVSYDGDLERHWEFSFITAVDSYLHLNSTLISNISTNKHPIILCRGADLFAEKSHFSNCVANKTSFFSMNPSKLEETGEITQSYATKMNSHSKFEEEDDEETESRRSRFLSSSSSSSSRKTRHLLSEIEQSTSSIHITDCTFSDINCVSNSLFFVDSTLPTRFWIDNTIFNYIYSSETGQPAVLSAGSYRMLPNDCSRFHLHSQQQSLSSLNSRSSLVDEETPTAIDINNSTFSSCVGLQSNRGGLISQHFCSPRSSFRTCNSSFGSSGCSGNGLGGGFYLSSTHSPVAYEFISCEFEAMIARKGKNVFICGKDLNSLVKPMCFRMNISLYDSESFSGFDEKHVGSTMAAMLEGSSDSVHDSLISDNIVDLIPLYLNVTRRENVYVSSENSNRNNSPECGTLKMPCGTLDIGFNRASLWTTSIVLVGNTTLTEVVIASDCKVRRENSSVGNAVLPRKIVAGLLEGVLNNFRDLSVDEILFLFEEGCDIVCPSFIFSDGVTLEINKCTFTSTLPAPSKLPFHIVATTNGLLKVFGCTFTSLSTAVSLICMTTMTDSEFASNTFNNVTLDGSALFEDGPNVSRNGLLLTNQHAVFSNINQLQQAQSIFSSSKSSSKLLFEGCSFLSCAQSNRDMDGSLIMLDFSSMDIYTSVFDESGSQKIECGSALSSSSSSSSLSNGKLKSSRSLSQPDVEPNKYCSWQTSLISVTRTKLYIKNTIFKRVCVGALFLSGEATRLDNASFVNNSCDDPASEGIHHNIRCNNEAMLEFIAGGEAEHADNFSSMWIDDSGCQFLMHEDIHAEASMYFVPSLASVTYHLNEENVVFSVKGQNMHPCELSLVLVNTHYEMRSVSIAIDAVSSPDAVTLNVPISMLSDIINNADATTLDHSKPVLRIWNRLFAPPPAPVLTTLPEMIAALSFRGKYKGGKAFQNGLASEENNTHEVLNTQFVTVEAEAPPEDKKKLSQNVIIAISVGSSLAALAFAAFTIIAFRICLKSSKKYNKLSEGSALLSINTNEYSSFSFSNANRMEANSFVMSVPADCQSPHFEED